MKSFEVMINGKKQCTAGVGDSGVLNAIVALVKGTRSSDEIEQAQEDNESLDIRVGGLSNIDPDTYEHLEWLHHDLSVGDEVTIKIVDGPECDPPKTREISYFRCSFCEKRQTSTTKLIAGPGVYVCHQCVRDGQKAIIGNEPVGKMAAIPVGEQAEVRCSFCGDKPLDGMVGVGTARICNQCLSSCGELLEENYGRES